MRVTTETSVDRPTTERFLSLYRAAYAPLEPLAAARQSLTDDEFREEMADPSVVKLVGWSPSGEPVAMAVIATELDSVPWISPEFWRARFREQSDRGALFYFGALLVAPEAQGGPWAQRLLGEAVRFTASRRAVAAFDCCRFNVSEVHLPSLIAQVAEQLALVDTVEVDTQHYYAYVTYGLKDDQIDLTERPAVQSSRRVEAPET